MAMSDFEHAFRFVLRWEGGYVHDPEDPGGETKLGITKATLMQAYAKNIVKYTDIKRLTEEEAKKIYYELYWKPAHCDEIPSHLRLLHFDTAVNMGVKMAIKLLQTAAGAKPDGVWGPETASKVSKADLLYYGLMRAVTYGNIVGHNPKLTKFLKGWVNRLHAALKQSLNYE